jgi:5-methylcytosine-specific restriction endonuclease McrA
LDEAYFERAVFAPGRRVEVSPTTRLFSGATRRAVEVRDRACTHPYCDRPAEASQIDHIVPYAAGGATTQENGRVLCRFHNQLRNQRPPPDR